MATAGRASDLVLRFAAAIVGVAWLIVAVILGRRISTRRLAAFVAAAASASAAVAVAAWSVGSSSTWCGALAIVASIPAPIGFLILSTRRTLHHESALKWSATIITAAAALLVFSIAPVAVVGRRPDSHHRVYVLALALLSVVFACTFTRLNAATSATLRRLVVGERHSPETTIRTFGARLTRSLPLDELFLQLCESLYASMDLRSAEVWTGTDGVFDLLASIPHRRPPTLLLDARSLDVAARTTSAGRQWTEVWIPTLPRADTVEGGPLAIAPLVHAGHVLGFLIIGRPRGADVFTERDNEVLVDLARSVALALHNAQLDSQLSRTLDELRARAADLQASRARLVVAADEERRRLERDLHDGAQQQLVALAVNLRTARQLVRTDPAAVDALLGELATEAATAAAEVRDLAHGVYPPLLRESGLAAALRGGLARRPQSVSLEVGPERFSPDIEAALYFACREALQNAAKHAPEAEVSVRVRVAGQRVDFSVADNGAGIGPDRLETGHGLQNIRDRIGAVGGSVRWTATATTTTGALATTATMAGTPATTAGTTMSGFVPLPGDGLA